MIADLDLQMQNLGNKSVFLNITSVLADFLKTSKP